MSYTGNHLTLKELNTLESGLGDRIQHLLDTSRNSSDNERARKVIRAALANHKLKLSDVYVDGGLAAGLILDQAFQIAGDAYQFRDQFDA